jgi:uncharacterized protein
MSNALNWFEIPVADIDRARKFYQGMLAQDLKVEAFGGRPHAIFPAAGGPEAVSGALVQDEKRKPAADGALIYLNVEGRLDACLDRVPRSGGAVVLPRTSIGEHGFCALVKDSEGNVVGLHSMK